MTDRVDIIGLNVNVISKEQVCETVSRWCETRDSRYISVSNVHMCMEAFDSEGFRNIVNNSDLVVPDGRPLYWYQKFKGFSQAEQVRGMDLTLALCEHAEKNGIDIGFYGSTEEVLKSLELNLNRSFPKLNVAYIYSPPFRPLSDAEKNDVLLNIEKSHCQLLFVGLGCPNQEKWMASQKGNLSVTMVGVGAAFDFIAGNKSSAPKFVQKLGVEWLHRLVHEPKRLWRRYLIQNTRFIFHIVKAMFLK